MVPGAAVSLFCILTFLYPHPEAGGDNEARDANYFQSLLHKSHSVVKGQVEEPFCITKDRLK